LINGKELKNIDDIISKESSITTEKIFSTMVATDL